MEETLVNAFDEAILKLGAKYKNIVVASAPFLTPCATDLFAKNFPERHFDFGVAVANMVAASGGFVVRGRQPFLCSDAFALTTMAYEQIRNVVCYPNLNVKLIGLNAGTAFERKATQAHALEDIALMRSIPNLQIFSPADAEETRASLAAMADNFGPMYLRLSASVLEAVYQEKKCPFKIAKADILRKGNDICVFATGAMVAHVLMVADNLKKEDISVMVVNVSSIMPFDKSLILQCASRVKFCCSFEDHFVEGGLGSMLAEIFSTEYPTRLYRFGVKGFSQSGTKEELYQKYGLDVQGMGSTLMKLMKMC